MDTTMNRNDLAKRSLWIMLLTGATIAGSFVFACATPFPALGALSAMFMRKRDAFVLTVLNWLANQIIGYGFLHYPQTWDSFAWGAAIGIAALMATAAAIGTEALIRRAGWAVTAIAAFLVAFAAYEIALYATTAFLPSEPNDFSAKIVFYIVEVNAFAFAGLLLLQGIGRAAGLAMPRESGLIGTA